MERAERVVLGIDVGGTKVCVGVVTEDGRVVEKQRYPHRNVPVEEWTKELMAQTDALLERCGMRDRIAAVGIGCRGNVDHRSQRLLATTIMKLSPEFDFCRALRSRYGRPVYIDNDVKAVACAEIVFGAGRECGDFVCYNVGTGIAVASVAEGRLIRGRDNNAGEISTDYLPGGRDGEAAPGLEAAASGRGIEDQARALLNAYPDSALAAQGETLAARDVLAACREGIRWPGRWWGGPCTCWRPRRSTSGTC